MVPAVTEVLPRLRVVTKKAIIILLTITSTLVSQLVRRIHIVPLTTTWAKHLATQLCIRIV